MSDKTPEEQEAARCLGELWYPVINDLIGGYAITNQAGCIYVSEINNTFGGGRIIADCFSSEHAEHIAIIHNATVIALKNYTECDNSDGYGIGAGHECICKGKPNHTTQHWCGCGNVWGVGCELR